MFTVSLDVRGLIHIDYLLKGPTTNDDRVSYLLDLFRQGINKNRPSSFGQENNDLPVSVLMTKVVELKFDSLKLLRKEEPARLYPRNCHH